MTASRMTQNTATEKMIKTAILILFGLDLIVFAISSFFAEYNFVLNSQVAFFASLLVVLGSFSSLYSKLKSGALSAYEEEKGDPGDRHKLLYDDEEEQEAEVDFKEEKRRAGRFSLSSFVMGSKLFFSLQRVVAYVVLIASLLYLINSGLFNVWGYITGLLTLSIGMIAAQLVLSQKSPASF